jgi:hypothetical protein
MHSQLVSHSVGPAALFVAAIEDALFSSAHLPCIQDARKCLSALSNRSLVTLSLSAAEPCGSFLQSMPPACSYALGICIFRHWIAALSSKSPHAPSCSPTTQVHARLVSSRMRELCMQTVPAHLPALCCIAKGLAMCLQSWNANSDGAADVAIEAGDDSGCLRRLRV